MRRRNGKRMEREHKNCPIKKWRERKKKREREKGKNKTEAEGASIVV